MTRMLIDNSPFSDIDISILKIHILNKCPEISRLPPGQIDDLVKGIIDQIDNLYPNYGKFTLTDLYDILESDLLQYQNEVIEQIELENQFQRSCDLQERQLIQFQHQTN